MQRSKENLLVLVRTDQAQKYGCHRRTLINSRVAGPDGNRRPIDRVESIGSKVKFRLLFSMLDETSYPAKCSALPVVQDAWGSVL